MNTTSIPRRKKLSVYRKLIAATSALMLSLLGPISFLFLLPCFASAAPQIYIIKDRRGVVTFTSRRPDEGRVYRTFEPKRAAFSVYSYRSAWRRGGWTPRAVKSDYDGLIKDTATDHEVDPSLLKAVVHVESAFNSRARSNKGAMGLMQLMPGTARRFGVQNAYVPDQNVSGGTRYLRWLLDRYSGNEKLALAAYNAGEGAVDDYGTIPPYRETQTYVKRVLQMRELYRCKETGKQSC